MTALSSYYGKENEMKYAIVNNNKIQYINANPTVSFHPTVAAMYDTEVADIVFIEAGKL